MTSPTLNRQLDRFLARWPDARWHGFEPADCGTRDEALRLALGEPASLHYALDRAGFVVSLEDDLLGPGPQQLRNAGQWAARRRAALAGDGISVLLVAEPTPTLTGSKAQVRLPVASSRIPALIAALAEHIGVEEAKGPELSTDERKWVDAAAEGLQAHRGNGLVAVGPYQPAGGAGPRPPHQCGARGLGKNGVLHGPMARPALPTIASGALAADIADGAVETLIVCDANPVYTSPADIDFAALMQRVPLRLHAGLFYDETAETVSVAPAALAPVGELERRPRRRRDRNHDPADRPPALRYAWHSRTARVLLAEAVDDPGIDRGSDLARRCVGAGGRAAEEHWRGILRAGFVGGNRPPFAHSFRARRCQGRPMAAGGEPGEATGAGWKSSSVPTLASGTDGLPIAPGSRNCRNR